MSVHEPQPKAAGKVQYLDRRECRLDDRALLADMRRGIKDDNDLYVIRQYCDGATVEAIRSYAHDVGRHSLPAYFALAERAPDFHRIVHNDQRSFVKGT